MKRQTQKKIEELFNSLNTKTIPKKTNKGIMTTKMSVKSPIKINIEPEPEPEQEEIVPVPVPVPEITNEECLGSSSPSSTSSSVSSSNSQSLKLKDTLKIKNQHKRDLLISFEEKNHKYTINIDSVYSTPFISTTTLIHSLFPHFDADLVIKRMMNGRNWNDKNKYWGKTPDQIKELWTKNGNEVSKDGSNMHYFIECFMNQELADDVKLTHKNLYEEYERKKYKNMLNVGVEWGYFLQYVKYFPDFVPYRTEWMVFDEEAKICGSIDMVYINEDGSLNIYDWKRAKSIDKSSSFGEFCNLECLNDIPNSNFWHYSLQLNIYKHILEKCYGVVVKDLYLVRIHPNNTRKSFELIKIPNLNDRVKQLFEYRKSTLSLVCDDNIECNNKTTKNDDITMIQTTTN